MTKTALCLALLILILLLLGMCYVNEKVIFPTSPLPTPVSPLPTPILMVPTPPPAISIRSVSFDLNGDRMVDDRDLAIIEREFDLIGSSRADINNDGVVDIFDVVLVAYRYGEDYRQKLYLPIIFKDAR